IDPRQARVDAIKAFTRENNDITCEVIEIEKMSVDLLIKVIQNFIDSHPNRKKAIFTTNGVAMMSTAKALKHLNMHIGSN
ncbi:hypothetical protein, partial [Pseudomonas sp. H26/SER47-MNA-CIBAN-0231]|uniref:hypothetical protein n=1 Tax=Pseudomonas sp. H26/SER47-MNA-CIBAN-0231 TaxID=3140477 RepID=UPI00331EBDC7